MEPSSVRERLLNQRERLIYLEGARDKLFGPEPDLTLLGGNRPSNLVPARKPVQSSITVSEFKHGQTATVETLSKRKRTLREDLNAWMLEILAIIFASIILIVLAITLYVHRGKPLPSWPRYMTVNAILSFEALLFKTALILAVGSAISQSQWIWFASAHSLHDAVRYAEAREPVGSLVWLSMDIGKFKRPLTSLGAVIVIAAVLIDPVIQQMTQYENCKIDITGPGVTATVARTNIFSPQMLHVGAGLASPDSASQSPMLSGLFAEPQQANFECSTGNCTFDSYSTVGWCSKCEDVSKALSFGEAPTLFGQTATNPTSYLPDGLSVASTNTTGLYNYLVVQFNVTTSTMEVIHPWLNFTHDSDLLYHEFCTNTSNPTDWPCQGYGAASCKFAPCVRSYTANATGGKLSETLEEVAFFEPGDPNDLTGAGPGIIQFASDTALVDTHCITSSEHDHLVADGYTIDTSTRWLTFNMTNALTIAASTASNSTTYPESLLAHECLYLISKEFRTGYPGFFLQTVLNGTVTGFNEYGAPDGIFQGPQIIQNMLNFGNTSAAYIGNIMDNAATSVTNFMRQNGVVGYSTDINGTVSQFETCVNIRWGWIALPLVLDLLAMALLTLSIWVTWRNQAPIWKNSLLAFVFHGPNGVSDSSETAHSSAGVDTIEAMNERARKITVKLDDSESDQTKLIKVDKLSENSPCSSSQAFMRSRQSL
jgi:hypothetical protein